MWSEPVDEDAWWIGESGRSLENLGYKVWAILRAVGAKAYLQANEGGHQITTKANAVVNTDLIIVTAASSLDADVATIWEALKQQTFC